MTIGVKICGITSLEAVDAAIAAGAAYGGLVFHPKSPRNVGVVQASKLADRMRGKLKIVALVAEASDDDLLVIASQIRPDFFQFHGCEPPQRIAAVRARFKIPAIKALPVAETADFDQVAAFEAVADMLLFDAKAPKGADRSGGHGAAFDWSLLQGRAFAKPWFLAGGLTPANVARAVVLSRAALVDVSSGVESAPGVKDAARIVQFVNATKQPVQA